MASAISADSSQLAALVVYADSGGSNLVVSASQTALLVSYAQTVFARYGNASQAALLVPYGVTDMTSPFVSQTALLTVYATGTSDNTRSRAWTFVLDGHTFYALDLGEEGTFVYDLTTKQWSQFSTTGYAGWNMKFGTMWGEGRIAGGDSINPYVWELDPDRTTDEEFRSIEHVATGGLVSRSRRAKSVGRFVLTGSAGAVDDVEGATISLRWSDDQGNTWSDLRPIPLTAGQFSQEVAWRSLGSFAAPGRIFEISDVGGLLRIDGADAGIDDFDEDEAPSRG
jgi:hypothetical protein